MQNVRKIICFYIYIWEIISCKKTGVVHTSISFLHTFSIKVSLNKISKNSNQELFIKQLFRYPFVHSVFYFCKLCVRMAYRESAVNPILLCRLTGRCRRREALNGFGAKRNSRGFRFALWLTAITSLIAFRVLSRAWHTLRGLFATPCQSSVKTVGDQKGVATLRHSRDAALELVVRSLGTERISSPSRISFEFSHVSNHRVWFSLTFLFLFESLWVIFSMHIITVCLW